jgi:UDP-4-amino-4,6-dideoxy-N-acetyl-beta-L-altrosamine transaminase
LGPTISPPISGRTAISDAKSSPRFSGRPLNYGRHRIEREDIDAVVRVLEGEFITQGPVVARLEAAIAERVGARHAIAVSSGTAALHIAALAAGMKPGSHGITSAITFAASANAMIYCGADVSFVDIESTHVAMDADKLGRELDRRPDSSVIIPVHMAGLAADMAALRAKAGKRIIIEDASHALGAKYADGRPVGCGDHTDMTVFSFHPVKPVTTGEGGMVMTNDDTLAQTLRLLRNHGIQREADQFENMEQAFPDGSDIVAPWYQEQQMMGFNYRMSDIHAALGLSQLDKLDEFNARRRQIAYRYDDAFGKVTHVRPYHGGREARERSSHHLYLVDIDFKQLGKSRTTVIHELLRHGVGSQVHYLPVYRHPAHALPGLDCDAAFPGAERYYRGCLSLPLFQDLTDEEAGRVIAAVHEVCGG